ncbi:uncharacterized protein CXorf65 homolog [Actinia tenebrosa]|uniref:Uncharacterized protein CXorf65 homolog n=1 Tax=Actinia tenebrosa TaxID=6105 RepID=A0A6P8J2U2_ACTTE|nr:uncharacterized protein CXorf65 homolog [Actinia tenebrosa]
MFVVVRFGDDEQRLFNTNCRAKILYENIKERCNCQSEDVIDLADENGFLKNLPGRPPNEYATTFLPNRSTFILLQITEDNTSKQKQSVYTPLLRGVSESIPDFLAKLYSKKVNPEISIPGPVISRSQSPKPSAIGKGKLASKTQVRATPRSKGRFH